jgi:DNA transformation protein and related proteins
MAVSDDYLQYALEQLKGLGQVTPRRMFGGVGLYHDARFFAIIMADTLYFKVNDSNRGDYDSRGMRRFRPYADKPHLSMTYYEVPADTLEDADECVLWARKSVEASNGPRAAAAVTQQPAARQKRKRRR